MLPLLLLALAPSQALTTHDTGWVRCNGGSLPVTIPVSPDPCAALVIEPIVLEYRYSGQLVLHPAAPSSVWVAGDPGSVVYWLSEHPHTTWNPYTGPSPWVPPLASPLAGGGSWSALLSEPGEIVEYVDVTSFYAPIETTTIPNARERFTLLGQRRGFDMARVWLTPDYHPSGQGAHWVWLGPSWGGSHSPVAWSEPTVEARMVFVTRWL